MLALCIGREIELRKRGRAVQATFQKHTEHLSFLDSGGWNSRTWCKKQNKNTHAINKSLDALAQFCILTPVDAHPDEQVRHSKWSSP